MSRGIEPRIATMLLEAQRAGACLRLSRGNDRRTLHRRVSVGDVVEPDPGVFADAVWWSSLSRASRMIQRIRACAAAHKTWVFCSYSAALLYGIDLPFELMSKIHTVRDNRCQGQSSGRIVRHGIPGEPAFVRIRGIPATGIDETILQCLCDTSLEFGLAIVDAALRAELTSRERLEQHFATRGRGRRGIGQAVETLRLADARSENGGESRVRAILIEEGFAPDDLQVVFDDPRHAGRTFRVDYLWRRPDGCVVVGELDGRGKHWDPNMVGNRSFEEVIDHERQREALLTVYGLRMVRFGFAQAQDRPSLVQLLNLYGLSRIPYRFTTCRSRAPHVRYA